MKAKYTLLMMLLAFAFSAAPAAAQQPGRRNSTVTSRQESKAEKQQQKVDQVQKPTNINNQSATDQKVRDSQKGGRPSDNGRNGNGFGNGGNRPSDNGQHGNGFGHGGNRPSDNGQHGNGFGHGGNRPSDNGQHGNGFGNGGNRPSDNGQHGNGFGNGFGHGHGNHGNIDYGKRPPVAPRIDWNRNQIYERTNASSIVVNTVFRTKKEAYDYIAWLLDERYYTMNSYGNSYNWILSDVAFIPTPFDWTNPMTHNQFRMKFYITKSLGVVKVQITAEWRESILSTGFSKLRFQPSDRYSTYYAWNVLEDFAENIPHSYIYYR